MTPLYCLDFSGARDAGKRLWVTRAMADDSSLHVDDVRPARELPGGATERRQALAAVRQAIRHSGAAIWGMDLPFILPADVLEAAGWQGFLQRFTERFPDPDSMRRRCLEMTGGKELKRPTEQAARVPFSTWNLRLYRQTWHGIAEILRPLILADEAAAVPLQLPRPERPSLLEVCPASYLKAHGLYTSYKGRQPLHREARQRILAYLRNAAVSLPEPLAERLISDPGGDALDSLLAAHIAWRTSRAPDWPPNQPSPDGRVYTG